MKKASLSYGMGICAILIASTAWAGGSSSVGPAHPASSYCEKVGGNSQDWSTLEGDTYHSDSEGGLCRFGEAAIDEFALWYHRRSVQVTAVKIFLEHPEVQTQGPGEAVKYCQKVGGKVELGVDRNGNGVAVCTFDTAEDGLSTIGLSTLFRGPKDPRNAELLKLLKVKK